MTWKKNYKKYNTHTGTDYVIDYKSISKDIKASCDVSGWFWRYGKLNSKGDVIDLNKDANKDDFIILTYLINGSGLNGFVDRYNKTLDMLTEFGAMHCINKTMERAPSNYTFEDSRISTWEAPYVPRTSHMQLSKLGNRIKDYLKIAKDSRPKYLKQKNK